MGLLAVSAHHHVARHTAVHHNKGFANLAQMLEISLFVHYKSTSNVHIPTLVGVFFSYFRSLRVLLYRVFVKMQALFLYDLYKIIEKFLYTLTKDGDHTANQWVSW